VSDATGSGVRSLGSKRQTHPTRVRPANQAASVAGRGSGTPGTLRGCACPAACLGRRWEGALLRPLPLLADYGSVGSAYDPPKMSVFPNVAGQTLFGAGAVGSVVDVPVRKLYSAWR
jgi:hypothetical protein